MLRKVKRSTERIVDVTGYIDLASACVRANQTGFFALNQRVAADSYDSTTRDIDPRNCFIGGRRVELAIDAKNYDTFAARASDNGVNADPTGDGNANNES